MKDKYGNTPLILAVKLSYKNEDEYYKIIKTLLYHGADPTIRDLNNWSILDETLSLV